MEHVAALTEGESGRAMQMEREVPAASSPGASDAWEFHRDSSGEVEEGLGMRRREGERGAEYAEKPVDFDCSICLNYVELPVVTQCGHLFCWACIYQWARKSSICSICPICKCDLDISTVVTIFSKGKSRIGGEYGMPNPPPVKRVYTKKPLEIFNTGMFTFQDGGVVRGGHGIFQMGTYAARGSSPAFMKSFIFTRILFLLMAVALVLFFILE
jgi:zinc finger of C3HC4-type, RING